MFCGMMLLEGEFRGLHVSGKVHNSLIMTKCRNRKNVYVLKISTVVLGPRKVTFNVKTVQNLN